MRWGAGGPAIGRAFLDSHRPRWLEQRGEGGEKSGLFCYFWSRLYLLGRSLSNSVRDRAVLGVEFLGFGGALD